MRSQVVGIPRWRLPGRTASARLLDYLKVVPVARVNQCSFLLGVRMHIRTIQDLAEQGKVILEGKGQRALVWRTGYQAVEQVGGTYPDLGWHPFFGPLALLSLAKPESKIYLGPEFTAWSKEEFGKDRPTHWDEERGGLGAGIMVSEDALGEVTWTIPVHQKERKAQATAEAIMSDMAGMLMARGRDRRILHLHFVFGMEFGGSLPSKWVVKRLIQFFEDCFKPTRLVYDAKSRSEIRLARFQVHFGLISGVGRHPSAWKIWEQIRPIHSRRYGARISDLLGLEDGKYEKTG